MDNKKKKTIGVVSNAIVIVILVFVALITLSIILSYGKGYTNLFGNAYVSVLSESMDGPNPGYEVDGFKKGDLIRIKILSDDEKANLKEGDIITFYQIIEGTRQLNTHRIIEVKTGASVSYVTQGDNSPAHESVAPTSIVGLYTGHHISGLGNFVNFFHSSAGFFSCVVVPSLLIVAYFAVNLFLTVKSVKSVSDEEAKADEKERMREELLKELREQGKIKEEPSSDTGTPAEGTSEEETK